MKVGVTVSIKHVRAPRNHFLRQDAALCHGGCEDLSHAYVPACQPFVDWMVVDRHVYSYCEVTGALPVCVARV